MLERDSPAQSEISRDRRLFAERAARSVSEIQGNLSSVTDIIVFLEVLGYDETLVSKYGFADLTDFARYVFDFLDFVSAPAQPDQTLETKSKKVRRSAARLLEALALAFPMLAMLAVLFIFGVSLWMARILPIETTTAFLSGVFLGILISEGPVEAFSRLFSFYYSQNNLGEVKRVVRRNDYFVGVALLIAIAVLIAMSIVGGLPIILIFITIFSSVTIAAHRSSYLVIFALKRLGQMIAAYTAALAALVIIFLYAPSEGIAKVAALVPVNVINGVSSVAGIELVLRYFLALIVAFAILSVPALYYRAKIMNSKSTAQIKTPPPFYSPFSVGDRTVKSRLGVQLWETLPYFIFGTFFFLMIFADRIISWIFNPFVADYSGLPLEFNAVYHTGADPALIILLGVTIVSYVILAPIYEELGESSARMTIARADSVNGILQRAYARLLIAAAITSIVVAFLINYEGVEIMHFLRGTLVSLQILRIASIGDIFISIFFINAMFLTLVNKIKVPAIISVICTMIVVFVGMFLGFAGFQYIIWAYLLSSLIAMISSTVYCIRIRHNLSNLFLGRFV